MHAESPRDLLDFALDLAWRAGRLTLAHFQTNVAVEWKADHSPVTVADRAAERLCRERIERFYPRDGILGEEFGQDRPEAPRRWILDPIDGTRSFVRGVPLYGVLIALEEEEESVLGVLHFPALNETVWAARGQGCWWDGRRARVSAVASLREAALLTSGAEYFGPEATFAEAHPSMQAMADGFQRIHRRAGLARTWGDCYGHALVATGRAEIMLDPLSAVWDAAPLRPVIEEAGGAFTDWQGRPTHRGGSAVSTNSALASEVRALLASEDGGHEGTAVLS